MTRRAARPDRDRATLALLRRWRPVDDPDDVQDFARTIGQAECQIVHHHNARGESGWRYVVGCHDNGYLGEIDSVISTRLDSPAAAMAACEQFVDDARREALDRRMLDERRG